jgi:GxxExxY protein
MSLNVFRESWWGFVEKNKSSAKLNESFVEKPKNMSLIYKNEVYDIIGACFDVYKELSCGLSEPIYQEALEIEFNLRGIPFEREKELVVYYKGRKLRKKYVADFVCYDDIIVELKALDNVTSKEVSQLLNYLHITKYPLGLLVNFGHEDNLEWKRYANF